MSFFTPLVWCGSDSNMRPPTLKVDALPDSLYQKMREMRFFSNQNLYMFKLMDRKINII